MVETCPVSPLEAREASIGTVAVVECQNLDIRSYRAVAGRFWPVTFTNFLPGHLIGMNLQLSQHRELGRVEPLTRERGERLRDGGPAWTARGRRGDVLCCAGLFEQFDGAAATAWALLAAGMTKGEAMAVTRFARTRIAAARYARIDCIVESWNARAIRWAECVGFTRAHRLEAYGYAAEPHILFERIGNGR